MANGWGGARRGAGRKPKHPRTDTLCQVAKNKLCPYLSPLVRLASSADSQAAHDAAIRLREQFGIAVDVPSAVPYNALDAHTQPAPVEKTLAT